MAVLGLSSYGLLKLDDGTSPQVTAVCRGVRQVQGISLEVADTDAERVKGLSDRPSLPDDCGLLFVYGQASRHGIWMKDMHFPIDIVWLDEDKKIVHLLEHVQPETYPDVFQPSAPARYIIELNAGMAQQSGFSVGRQLSF